MGPTLSPNLQRLLEMSERLPTKPRSLPASNNNDPIVVSYTTLERSYYFSETRCIKIQNHPDDIGSCSSNIRFARERLLNEAASLQYLAQYSNIPVPKLRDIGDNERGMLQLETELLPNNAITLSMVAPPYRRKEAIQNVNDQMMSHILPHLSNLRSTAIGSVDPSLPVIPPARLLSSRGPGEEWPRGIKGDYGFVHGDLSDENIFVDQTSFEIVGIIDWEYAGFFPTAFEVPIWKTPDRQVRHGILMGAMREELIFFNGRGKIGNC
ncbi:hypothetical protein Vi05172_g1310 [Venturia inaequalis]|nr:hypothetical protein Vi05172_g1310 [Venturia inaequalis]